MVEPLPSKDYEDSEDYNVPQYDIESVIEIRKMINGVKYRDSSTARDHLQFLETMHNRLKRILEQERQAGIGDLDTEKFLHKVKNTYDELYTVYEKLVGKEAGKKKIKKKKLEHTGMRGFGSKGGL